MVGSNFILSSKFVNINDIEIKKIEETDVSIDVSIDVSNNEKKTRIPNNEKSENLEKILKLKAQNIYAILHLAAQSSGPKSLFIPREDIDKNIIGTLNIINFCSKNKIKRILFASSFVVYGKQEKNVSSNQTSIS